MNERRDLDIGPNHCFALNVASLRNHDDARDLRGDYLKLTVRRSRGPRRDRCRGQNLIDKVYIADYAVTLLPTLERSVDMRVWLVRICIKGHVSLDEPAALRSIVVLAAQNPASWTVIRPVTEDGALGIRTHPGSAAVVGEPEELVTAVRALPPRTDPRPACRRDNYPQILR